MCFFKAARWVHYDLTYAVTNPLWKPILLRLQPSGSW